MMVREVHTAVKGRVRFKVKGLYRAESLKVVLEAQVMRNSDVLRVSACVLTGNVLICFSPECNLRTIALLVEQVVLEYMQCLPRGKTQGVDRPTNEPMERAPSAAVVDEAANQWHCVDKSVVVDSLGSSTSWGLTDDCARANRSLYGPNTFPEVEQRSGLSIFFNQFNSLPVALLGVAAGLSLVTGGAADALVIAAVVGINAIIGYFTEREAEDAIASLRNLVKPTAAVLREGNVAVVEAEDVVAGDIVMLKPGTYIPADARVIEAMHLTVDESILTGESMPVSKSDKRLDDPDVPLGDRVSMLYAGTLVIGGHGSAVVVATGSRTEVGKIRSLLVQSEAPETPIERQLSAIGNQLVLLSAGVCGFVFVIGLLRGNGVLQMLKTAISLAVAAVPEGLPAVATTTLALGVRNMQRHKVLVRNLEAICTLGSVQTLCFDKTGTVTLNRMAVLRVFVGMSTIDVQTQGLDFRSGSSDGPRDNELSRLLDVCVLCNESEFERRNGAYAINGTATENALVYLAVDAGVDVTLLRARYPRIATEHRSDDRQFMTTLHETDNGERLLCLKGSPVEVLAKCTHLMKDGEVLGLTEEDRDRIEAANESLAGDALRVLGAAFSLENGKGASAQQSGLVWLGLLGMADPLRAGAKESIRRFHRAGLETVMITGDQSPTAYAVGRELGLNNGKPLEILESTNLSATDPCMLKSLCRKAQIFSRVSPSNKLQIVQALQSSGKVVAMTGDGINDGPALKAADIGIAMGRGGTDVARDVADVVLEEDDLATLIIAIRDGRTTYLNIRKTLRYLLSTNLSEIEVMFVSGALGLGYPLNAMQLLWINLISDIFPGLALALEPPETDVMERPPRDPMETIVHTDDLKRIGFEATVMAVSSLGAYGYGILRYGLGAQAGTLAFQSLTTAQILHALSCRSEARGLLGNDRRPANTYLTGAVAGSLALQVIAQLVPGLRSLLGISPISAVDALVIAAAGLFPLLVSEATKEGGQIRKQ